MIINDPEELIKRLQTAVLVTLIYQNDVSFSFSLHIG